MLLLTLIITASASNYWETQPQFVPPTDDISQLCQKTFLLDDVTKSTGVFPNKSTYTLKNISTSLLFTSGKTDILSDRVVFSNQTLQLKITFVAQKNKKDYLGNGTSTLSSLIINMTKRMQLQSGKAYFQFDRLTFNYSLSTNISTVYEPEPSSGDKEIFEELVKKDIVSQLSFIFNTTLYDWLNDIAKETHISTTFSGMYPYTHKQTTLNLNMSIADISFGHNGTGLLVGYNASIGRLSPFRPEIQQAATYITLQMLQDVSQYFWKNSKVITFDHSFKNDILQFYMVDLEYILPDAVNKYGGLDDKFTVGCMAQDSNVWLNQSIVANTTWLCSCRHQEGQTLLNFRTRVEYNVGVQQQGSSIVTTITSASIVQVQFIEMKEYPLKMKPLAAEYVRTIVNQLVGSHTIGTGFKQPTRNKTNVLITEQYVMLAQAIQQQSPIA